MSLDLSRALPGLQSTLAPASDAADAISQLGLVLYGCGAAILALVLVLAAIGALNPPRRVNASAWLIGGGLVLPIVVLGALLVYALHMGHALSVAASRPADIEVTGKMWWWEVRYVDATAGKNVTLANELYVPVGRPVEIALRSDNVIHSFWVPALAGKVDMVPGRVPRTVRRVLRGATRMDGVLRRGSTGRGVPAMAGAPGRSGKRAQRCIS